MGLTPLEGHPLATTILPISDSDFEFEHSIAGSFLHPWRLKPVTATSSARNLEIATSHLRNKTSPVALPTETVYGLAADATSSESVLSIFSAKRRPADNPLIVHIASLDQLRSLIDPSYSAPEEFRNGHLDGEKPDVFGENDPIPRIYHPLIERFWPGPLTILLPLPTPNPFAPEVSAGQSTFGVRMPSSKLALAIIKAADRPLAAPSANASTRPSPTTAEHVYHDLEGRIELILDGGPCSVGVESTVVDGLSDPPVVLRPGGVGMEGLLGCVGWEGVTKAWDDKEGGGVAGEKKGPRAPGMKYRHYSPRAKVILVEHGVPFGEGISRAIGSETDSSKEPGKVGIVRTRSLNARKMEPIDQESRDVTSDSVEQSYDIKSNALSGYEFLDIYIGPSNTDVARGLFRSLRELDHKGVDMMIVEGINDAEGETAAAVMNRLRKAAGNTIKTQ